MKWNKLRKRIEDNFAESLNSKVKIYFTKYTSDYDAGDMANRAWITVDGKEVVNFSTLEAFNITGCVYNATTPTDIWKIDKSELKRENGKLIAKGEFSAFDFTECCFEFLNMSIDDAFNHESAILNFLAVLDKRFGKRRLKKTDSEDFHPLAEYFFNLRLVAENIKTTGNIA
ncbi:SF0329 family protein [Marinirhabdus gelatinilytica]|uniref:Uncharacterized protein n=1 Tax=Marinirhabdus gelatinilytica TaxID=1703343 RepID=A0A370QFZ1_9FLAO|nr:hypothetical protein [Marinirhabdus gelatinilytica]RDK87284.1 hypothetical protein C8D94_102471 [Marinirhabdus gelatinilytica]